MNSLLEIVGMPWSSETAMAADGRTNAGRKSLPPCRCSSDRDGMTLTYAVSSPSPVRVYGQRDESISRWLWLVKWLLLIPHLFVLLFLWITFAVLTLVAWIAIVTTARYPKWIFDFNVGVLRWSWRVAYYSYAALGTDWYPPFTLADVLDYPARLEIDYPERLSRALALVKWWLLAFPHYLVLGLFLGGSIDLWRDEHLVLRSGGGLITVLVLIAAVALLFTGRYRQACSIWCWG